MFVYDIFFYFFRCINCVSTVNSASINVYTPTTSSPKPTVIKVRELRIPNKYDIMNVTTSIHIIFSKLSPGYCEAIAKRNLNPSTSPIVYFYKIVYIEFSVKDIFENDMYSRIFMDILTCIIECIKEPYEEWAETAIFYNIHHISRNNMDLIWEILENALAAILLENKDGAVITSWKVVYWEIYRSVETMTKDAFFINI